MKTANLTLALLAATVAFSASAATSTKEAVKAMSTCDKVSTLIKESTNGFSKARGMVTTGTRYGDVWRAKYNLIGSNCEIWQVGGANAHYVCSRSTPNEAVADDYYKNANAGIEKCLGSSWTKAEEPRASQSGMKTTFSKAGSDQVFEVHKVKVDGIFKDQWSVFYIMGGPTGKP